MLEIKKIRSVSDVTLVSLIGDFEQILLDVIVDVDLILFEPASIIQKKVCKKITIS